MEILQVDAFTDRPFAGNPAAVCFMEGERDSEWMQAVAREMNLSETAFLAADGDAWRLRWFTPEAEVDLCGHATLASAHAIWETGRQGRDEVLRFTSRSGLLTARRDGPWIELDFPARPPRRAEAPGGLLESLGIDAPRWVGRNDESDLLVLLDHETEVRALDPDMRGLAAVDCRGTMVTAPGEGDVDFVSRFFAPAVGVDEDPVTGSAHCCLGPFWADRLDRRELIGFQASARGGRVRVAVRNDRVSLGGQAVTVFRGTLRC